MLTIFRMIASKSGWLLLSFVGIVIVLALANELPAKLSDWKAEAVRAKQLARELETDLPNFDKAAHDAIHAADAEIASLKRASDARLATAERDIAQRTEDANRRVLINPKIAIFKGQADQIVASYHAKYIELPLLKRASQLIEIRRENFRNVRTRQAQISSLRQAHALHAAKIAAFNKRAGERNALQRQADAQLRARVCRSVDLPFGCGLVREVKKRDAALTVERLQLEQDAQDLRDRKAAMRELALRREQFADGAAIARSATDAYAAEVNRQSRQAGDYTWNRVTDAFQRYSGTAFWILLGAVLVPILHKLFAFLVIAPFAARASPVRLRNGGQPLVATASGKSVDVAIDCDSELLLRSGLQSSSVDIRGSDQYLLDCRMPLTCFAAGLFNLQRLRSDRPDHIVVTGTDENHRLALITVPEDGAIVLQPRALLGLVKPRGRRLVITRPWRVRWLISWITAQFRYVVFHGPCTLIVQGQSGVQVEDAARGRMINKRLTLGFDAGLAYGAARSASFLPYLRGEASLFNDRFHGTGFYLYEQRAAGMGKGGLWGRGLKGIGDTVLSALGV
ncbi:hypothetical protein EGM87_17265 [Sphingobium sp. RSMS]|uniref:hypothetical protein n=1 Tax=Sphingobium sp. RSMS TaxID=520734 RepID=UPI0010F8ED5B|nr:hypothetical protein [Sphingobium sp. RSMS]UXC90747.1 hypothetical protein EGM87_17265 [Sphingobium sp. RSMS]